MTKKLKSFIYEGKEIDFPFPIEVEIIEGRADTSQVFKTLVDAYNELKEKYEELLKYNSINAQLEILNALNK